MSIISREAQRYKLSPREQETLTLLGSGQTQKAAADKMGCSHRTVEIYSRTLRKKMRVPNIAAAVWLILHPRT